MPRAVRTKWPGRVPLEQDLDGSLGRAALPHQLHRPVKIRLASGKPLGERQGIPGFHQDVEAPALDFRALSAVRLDDLGRLSHGVIRSPFSRRTLPQFVCRELQPETGFTSW